MNATPFTPSFIGATGQYPIFEYVDSSSNSNYLYSSNTSNSIFGYSSNLKSEIESLKQKDISHDSSITSINSTIGTIQGEVAANTTAIAGQATQITTLQTTTAANTTAIATNTGAIVDINLNKVNKTSFNSTGLIYMDVAGNVQLSYDNTAFKQYYTVSGNAGVLTLNDIYKNLPTNLNDNFYDRTQLSNVFATSNVLSNTSNFLVNYSNLINLPSIYTRSELSNIFITSNVLSNTSNFLVNYSNLINLPSIYTRSELSNIFITSNVLSNTSNTLFDFTKTTSNNCAEFSKVLSNNIKTDINTNITTQKITIDTTDINSNDSILNVSNMICVRKIQNTVEPFDSFDICMGTGNINNLTLVETANDGFVLYTNNYCGLKILNNKRIIITTPEKFYLNSIKTLFLTANKIRISSSTIILNGDIQTNGAIIKKAPRYFTTTRTATFGGVNCLAYDIDLSLYTSKATLDGFDFRHFRIKFFFANGRVDYQWSPKTYNISLSTYNTLSAMNESPWGMDNLDTADSQGYFLYRQNIDKITFCAPTAMFGSTNLKLYFIIEDLQAT